MIYVGMDDSKKSIEIAALSDDGELVEAKIANTGMAVGKLVRKLRRNFGGQRLEFVYEAGPGGYVLQRRLEQLGEVCMVAAPSLTPKAKGMRVKTNRRDAMQLARLLKGEMLEEVVPPGPMEEADRELCRCRAKLGSDLKRARQRVGHFLLRRGLSYSGSNWSQKYWKWLRQLQLEQASDQQVLMRYVWQVEQLEQCSVSAAEEIERLAQTDRYRAVVGALRCYRGVDTYTALSFVCELYGMGRFTSARGLMNFLGLVPSENSTGEQQQRGGITKTGNRYVRRLLVEAAHHYRRVPQVGWGLKQRRQGQAAEAIAHADKAMTRLYRKYQRMSWRGKPPNKITVAVARELCGFLWATATAHFSKEFDRVA